MKTKKYLIFILFAVILLKPILCKSQSLSFKEPEKHNPVKAGWQPLVLDTKTNVLDGVEFYAQKGDCPYGVTLLLKLVNANNYSVKVSYQASPESQIVNVLLPASATLEGSCNTIEGNLSKLLIRVPEKKEDKQKIKQYLTSHISVSKY